MAARQRPGATLTHRKGPEPPLQACAPTCGQQGHRTRTCCQAPGVWWPLGCSSIACGTPPTADRPTSAHRPGPERHPQPHLPSEPPAPCAAPLHAAPAPSAPAAPSAAPAACVPAPASFPAAPGGPCNKNVAASSPKGGFLLPAPVLLLTSVSCLFKLFNPWRLKGRKCEQAHPEEACPTSTANGRAGTRRQGPLGTNLLLLECSTFLVTGAKTPQACITALVHPHAHEVSL